LGFAGRFRSAWKAATLSPGERAPLPRQSYPSFISGLDSFTDLQSRHRPVNPNDANEGRDNPIVMACINYIASSWAVAEPQVGAYQGDKFTPSPSPSPHPFLDKLINPNPNYSGDWLTWALLTDYWRKGNAYAHIVRDRRGQILEINWLPARYVRPIPDNMGYLSHFEYVPFGSYLAIPPQDMVHIRFGVDETLPLQGVSPLAAVYREIVTDNSYSDYAAGLAQWSGVPPYGFSPRVVKTQSGEDRVTMSEDTARTMAQKLKERFRSKPGEPLVLTGAMEMQKLAFSPDDMKMLDARAMPETRIPAAFGLPVLVLQLYTGIQKSTFSNMETAVKQAWRGCIIPNQRIFASAFSRKCLALYPQTQPGEVLEWTTGAVQELREDNLDVRKQAASEYEGGILTLEETRAEGGRQTDPATLAKLEEAQQAKLATGLLQPLAQEGQTPPETVTVAGKTYWLMPASAVKKKPIAPTL
jgi:HK97 family phage portal protein